MITKKLIVCHIVYDALIKSGVEDANIIEEVKS